MTEWTVVFWSSARQIAQEAKLPRDLWPEADIAPAAFFAQLRAAGEDTAAAAYLACALPKLETIEWGLASLPPLGREDPEYAPRMLLRDAAQRWLHEPDDENRRAIERLLEGADQSWPEALIGLAIFFSGGSIAPEDSPPVPADPRLPGQLVAGAVQTVIAQNAIDDPGLAVRVLDLGNRFAVNGREAVGARWR
ncbi:MAG: hypothetical protein KAF27_00765 [Porphyrobacter sp.]|nr:hypothetical protein [Porphyrobacter sp.]